MCLFFREPMGVGDSWFEDVECGNDEGVRLGDVWDAVEMVVRRRGWEGVCLRRVLVKCETFADVVVLCFVDGY